MGPPYIAVDGGAPAASGDCSRFLGWEEEDRERGRGVAELCWRGIIGDLFSAILEGFGTSEKGEEGEAKRGLSRGAGCFW